MVAVGDYSNNDVVVWNLSHRPLISQTLTGHFFPVFNQELISGSNQGEVFLWRLEFERWPARL
jgi:hypothetical protein